MGVGVSLVLFAVAYGEKLSALIVFTLFFAAFFASRLSSVARGSSFFLAAVRYAAS